MKLYVYKLDGWWIISVHPKWGLNERALFRDRSFDAVMARLSLVFKDNQDWIRKWVGYERKVES